MDYYFSTSSAFSAEPVDGLNELAGKLDRRLYVFAYYKPKRYDSVDGIGAREAFWMAVTNLYALYHDCSPFRKKLETVFDKNHKPPINFIRSFHDLLSDLRGMYCHNCSDDDNPYVIYGVIASFKKIDSNLDFLPDDDNFREANLLFDESQWENALRFLCETSDEIIGNYQRRLTNLKNSPEKQVYVEKMLEEIASWTTYAYPGLIRFMQEFVVLSGRNYSKKVIKIYWLSEESREALLCCTKDLLFPGSDAISGTAYPIPLLKTAFPKCKGFNEKNRKIKSFEYESK